MASDFLRRLLKRGSEASSQRPKVDVHALYTNCKMSRVLMQGQLSVHEPWRKHKKKPKSVHMALYTNDSSPFLVWFADRANKKARGFCNIQGGKIVPIGEYSFQIVFSGKTNQIYKFNTECWDTREEWLYALRDESRRETAMPELSNVTPSLMQSKDDIAITHQSQHQRPPWKGHRRTLSAGSPSPQLDRCQVSLQRSRSQPHIQKGKLIKKRATVLNSSKPKSTVGQSIQGQKFFVRSPEVCRS